MTATELLSENNLVLGTATKSDVLKAYQMADDSGTIQWGDAQKLFGNSDPTLTRCMGLREAWLILGCVEDEE